VYFLALPTKVTMLIADYEELLTLLETDKEKWQWMIDDIQKQIRLIGWLYPKCNHCNKGRLQKIDTYHHGKNMDIDIYRCNNCKNRVGVNAT
jgi:hypothetical protein